MQSRRDFLARAAAGAGLAAAAGVCLGFQGDDGPDAADERIPDGSAAKNMLTPAADQAIQKGLAYLNARRHHDGSFGTGGYSGNVAVTALAGMAFMCGGHQPSRGTYGKAVLGALRFILGKENTSGRWAGYLHNPAASPHGAMYGHGFATLFVSEAYGMASDNRTREDCRKKLRLAVKLILDAQRRNFEKAWRYEPNSNDADLSVAVCQMMALRSARNAGVFVPKSSIDDAVKYVKACQDKIGGWFKYTTRGGGMGGSDSFARTAAGVCALYAAGEYRAPEVTAGLKFLARHKPGGRIFRPDLHYYYGHYYAVQAMYTAGGDYWRSWFPAIREELLESQKGDGSWADPACTQCPHYATAMACIILQVPNNYLPILQK